jgi:ribose transport system ATP-binding protein
MQGHSTEDLAAMIVGGDIDPPEVAAAEIVNTAALHVERLVAGAARGVNLHVQAGEIVGLAGLSGAGCSSLIRAIAGDLWRSSGIVRIGEQELPTTGVQANRRVGVIYLPDQRSRIGFADMSLAANITGRRVAQFWHYGLLSRKAERRASDAILDRFTVVAPSSNVPLSALSGGNQQKVLVAAALNLRPRVLLLDEPTHGVDIGARQAIHSLIQFAATEGACVLVASSDLDELIKLCHRVIVLQRGQVAEVLAGTGLRHQTLLTAIQSGYLIIEPLAADRDLRIQ